MCFWSMVDAIHEIGTKIGLIVMLAPKRQRKGSWIESEQLDCQLAEKAWKWGHGDPAEPTLRQ